MEKKIKEVKELLRKVIYPGTSKNIVDLNMIDRLQITEDGVSFQLVFQKKNDPFAFSLKKKSEVALHEGGFSNVTVEISNPQDLERPLSLERVKYVIAISSGKGGVGKSTVAANLAIALALDGYRVGLIDADIFGPSIPKMFGVEQVRPLIVNVGGKDMIEPAEKYGVKLLSIGFFVDPDSATVWRGPMASGALKQLIEEANWGELDYLLIDLPPGTSDIHLTLVQTIALTGAIVVSTPQEVAIADAVKGINMFESDAISVPVLGIIENMAWFTPPELPDKRYYLFGKEGAKKLALSKGVPLLGEIPIVEQIMESGDIGRPAALENKSPIGEAFRKLAASVEEAVEQIKEVAKRVRIK